jgi:hypothetical protein
MSGADRHRGHNGGGHPGSDAEQLASRFVSVCTRLGRAGVDHTCILWGPVQQINLSGNLCVLLIHQGREGQFSVYQRTGIQGLSGLQASSGIQQPGQSGPQGRPGVQDQAMAWRVPTDTAATMAGGVQATMRKSLRRALSVSALGG